MKNNDFDDIGKRLHDMEADSPKNGWSKISIDLQPNRPGKVFWFRKNWWKPLILFIPALLYLPFSEIDLDQVTQSSVSAANSSVEQVLPKENSNDLVLSDSTDSKSNEHKTENGNTIATNQANNFSTADKLIVASQPTVRQQEKHENAIAVMVLADRTSLIASEEIKDMESSDGNYITPITVNEQTAGFLNESRNDSLVVTETIDNPADTALLSSSAENETQREKKTDSWRISVAFVPQLLTSTARPLTNDEVLVTEIKQDNYLQRVGYGFAMGLGKAVTSNLYIDGQLSYSIIRQTIQFGYSNGTVDTLLTVEQPDQSYRVTPVYAIDNREISGNYKYGGIKLGATYYFLSTPRSRFNMTANMGAHYLLSAKITEKINEEWIALDSKNLNTMNYSFSVGAGYTMKMHKGWELMINPMLTWYFRDVKSQNVPFSLREEALGLNFMLSKTLGR